MHSDNIAEEFLRLEDWDDRYRYLIQLGLKLGPMPRDAYVDSNRVHGCSNNVWLQTIVSADADGSPRLSFRADSDAHIVRGHLAIVLDIYSDHTADEILASDPSLLFSALGLSKELGSNRANGLRARVTRIKNDATAAPSVT
ncbi:SufE family protein [Methylocystis echinoides]|uniref:Cysteine desulfurization protein SufE n=1 Tax=Methylocystis echinoides TaxID=29468 RepID=A0A9W6GXY3_9HYPH|nr:SufE family protein [Methylocystis echinoides]GLI94909.1 cysteine desulfurization protein SufE [Methylocystis echinoides]